MQIIIEIKLKMKKDTVLFRHPYYPEIKFKRKSVKTTSTMSTSNHEEDLSNFERLSLTGDPNH